MTEQIFNAGDVVYLNSESKAAMTVKHASSHEITCVFYSEQKGEYMEQTFSPETLTLHIKKR